MLKKMNLLFAVMMIVLVMTACSGNAAKENEEEIIETTEEIIETTEAAVEETKPEITEAEIAETEESTEEILLEMQFTETDDSVYASSNVRVRTAPSMDGDIAGSLSKGDKVHRTGYNDEWNRIIYNDEICYVAAGYLSTEKPAEETKATEPVKVVEPETATPAPTQAEEPLTEAPAPAPTEAPTQAAVGFTEYPSCRGDGVDRIYDDGRTSYVAPDGTETFD